MSKQKQQLKTYRDVYLQRKKAKAGETKPSYRSLYLQRSAEQKQGSKQEDLT